MAIKSFENREFKSSQRFTGSGLLNRQRIVEEAEKIEDLLKKCLCQDQDGTAGIDHLLEDYPHIKHLNSFGKQIVIRMLRSNSRFWGYKVDISQHILKPHVLFLIGTLCDSFDYMNTSPLNGLSILDVGCGALSSYAEGDADDDLIRQFYHDHPPIAAELVQMLGASTTGLDPRTHCASVYEYQVSYKHKKVGFNRVVDWLKSYSKRFDVISCFNLFSRQSFLYSYGSSELMTIFFRGLRQGLMPHGLLYTSSPHLPHTLENRHENRQIFIKAGFRVVYEGYYFILECAGE